MTIPIWLFVIMAICTGIVVACVGCMCVGFIVGVVDEFKERVEIDEKDSN